MKKLKNLRHRVAARLRETFRNGEFERKAEILPPLYHYRKLHQPRTTQQRRQQEIYEALADVEASDWTYTQLQEIVRQKTGTACSRKVIARWKKEQNLKSPPSSSSPSV